MTQKKSKYRIRKTLESSFFANKMLNFGPIFKFFEMLFAELSDKTHHMCIFFVRLIRPAQWSVKDKRPRKKGKKLESSFFANKTLNFGPIFKIFKMLFAELSDKTHHMCNFFVRLIRTAQWSFKDERPRKKSRKIRKFVFC